MKAIPKHPTKPSGPAASPAHDQIPDEPPNLLPKSWLSVHQYQTEIQSQSYGGERKSGFIQARILEWVAVPFSRESSHPRDQIQVSHIAGRFFTS